MGLLPVSLKRLTVICCRVVLGKGFQDAPRPLVGHIGESGVVIDSGMDVVEPDRVFRSRIGRGLANRRCRGCG